MQNLASGGVAEQFLGVVRVGAVGTKMGPLGAVCWSGCGTQRHRDQEGNHAGLLPVCTEGIDWQWLQEDALCHAVRAWARSTWVRHGAE
jgi:hypothetical protein